MTEIREDENIAMRLRSQPEKTSSYRNWPVLLSVCWWIQPRRGTQRPKSSNKGSIYEQWGAQEIKLTKNWFETGASANASDMKMKYFMGKVEPVLF